MSIICNSCSIFFNVKPISILPTYLSKVDSTRNKYLLVYLQYYNLTNTCKKSLNHIHRYSKHISVYPLFPSSIT